MDKYKPVPCPECGFPIRPEDLDCQFCLGYETPLNPTIARNDLYDDDDEEIQKEPYTEEIQTILYG